MTNPFKGPKSYEKGDALYGREKETFDLLNLIESNNLTLLYSKSGIGKTSLINASLIPKLQQMHYFPLYLRLGAFINYRTKSSNFSEYIIQEITLELEKNKLKPPILKKRDSLFEFLHLLNLNASESGEMIPVVILDQLEVIFTLDLSDGDVTQLLSELKYSIEGEFPDYLTEFYNPKTEIDKFLEIQSVVKSQIKNFRFVFSFREEYLFDFENYSSKIPSIRYSANKYRLLPFKKAVAVEVITSISRGKIDLEQSTRIADNLLSDEKRNFAFEEIDPFLLSLVCSQLWNQINFSEIIITRNLVDNVIDHYVSRVYDRISHRAKIFFESYLITLDSKRTLFSHELASKWHIDANELILLVDDPELRFLNKEMYLDSYHVQILHDRLVPSIANRKKERELKEALEKEDKFRLEQENIRAAEEKKIRAEHEKIRKDEEERLLRDYMVQKKITADKKNRQLYLALFATLAIMGFAIFQWWNSDIEAKRNKSFKLALQLLNQGDSLQMLGEIEVKQDSSDLSKADIKSSAKRSRNKSFTLATEKYLESLKNQETIFAYERLVEVYHKFFEDGNLEILDSVSSLYEKSLAGRGLEGNFFSKVLATFSPRFIPGNRTEVAITKLTQRMLLADQKHFALNDSYYRGRMNDLYLHGFDSLALNMFSNIKRSNWTDKDYLISINLNHQNDDTKFNLLEECVKVFPHSCDCKRALIFPLLNGGKVQKAVSIIAEDYNKKTCDYSIEVIWVAKYLVRWSNSTENEKDLNIILNYLLTRVTDPYNLNEVAWRLAKRNQSLTLALKLSKKSIELDPTCANCWDTLSEIYLRLRNHKMAVQLNEKALSLDPLLREAIGRKPRLDSLMAVKQKKQN
jgi:hypothetical protein